MSKTYTPTILEPDEVEEFGAIVEDSLRRLLDGEPQDAAAVERGNAIIREAQERTAQALLFPDPAKGPTKESAGRYFAYQRQLREMGG